VTFQGGNRRQDLALGTGIVWLGSTDCDSIGDQSQVLLGDGLGVGNNLGFVIVGPKTNRPKRWPRRARKVGGGGRMAKRLAFESAGNHWFCKPAAWGGGANAVDIARGGGCVKRRLKHQVTSRSPQKRAENTTRKKGGGGVSGFTIRKRQLYKKTKTWIGR